MSKSAITPAAHDDRTASRNPWWTVAALTVIYWFGTLDRQVSALLVPQIKASLALSDFQLSLIQGVAFGVATMIASPAAGWLVDRYSRRKILFFSVIGWSLSAAWCGLSRGFWQLFAGRAGVGAFESPLNPSSYSMLGDLFPPGKLALPLSIYVLGGNLGSGMSFLAGGAVVAWIAASPPITQPYFGQLADWQMAFIVTGLPGLLIAPLALTTVEIRRSRPATDQGGAGYAELWQHMRRYAGFYVTHILGFATISAIIVGLQAWNAAYISRTFAWPVSKIGFVMGAAQLVTALAGLAFHGWAVDRLFTNGRKDAHFLYFLVMTVLCLPCAVLAYTVPNVTAMIILYNLAYFFIMAYASIGPAALQMATPVALRGKASSVYVIAMMLLGVILAPVFVASLTDFVFQDEALLGRSMAVFATSACVLAASLFAIGRPHMRRVVTAMIDR